MKTRYYLDNQMPVPKGLRHLTDAQLGRETCEREHADDGNPFAATAKDAKQEREADFIGIRARIRGEATA